MRSLLSPRFAPTRAPRTLLSVGAVAVLITVAALLPGLAHALPQANGQGSDRTRELRELRPVQRARLLLQGPQLAGLWRAPIAAATQDLAQGRAMRWAQGWRFQVTEQVGDLATATLLMDGVLGLAQKAVPFPGNVLAAWALGAASAKQLRHPSRVRFAEAMHGLAWTGQAVLTEGAKLLGSRFAAHALVAAGSLLGVAGGALQSVVGLARAVRALRTEGPERREAFTLAGFDLGAGLTWMAYSVGLGVPGSIIGFTAFTVARLVYTNRALIGTVASRVVERVLGRVLRSRQGEPEFTGYDSAGRMLVRTSSVSHTVAERSHAASGLGASFSSSGFVRELRASAILEGPHGERVPVVLVIPVKDPVR